MPFDASIISNMQQPDFSDAISKGINMRALANKNQMEKMQLQTAKQDFNDAQALKTAETKNTSIDADGNIKKDKPGILKDLANVDPRLAANAQIKYAQQDRERQTAQMQADEATHRYIGQMAAGAQNQGDWDKVMSAARDKGVPESTLSQYGNTFDPAIKNRAVNDALSVADQIKNQMEGQKIDIEKTKANLELEKQRTENYKTFGISGRPGGQGKLTQDTDPSTLISMAPPDQQKEVAKEIANKQNIAKIAPSLMDSFHKAADTFHATDIVPGVKNADQESFKTKLGAFFNDEQDKDVRQQKIDALYDETVPRVGDNSYRLKQKADALSALAASKSSAPLFKKTTGHDLNEFTNTRIDPGIFERKSPLTKTKTAQIHPALKDKSLDELMQMRAEHESASK